MNRFDRIMIAITIVWMSVLAGVGTYALITGAYALITGAITIG